MKETGEMLIERKYDRLEAIMKKLRTVAWVSILLIFVFMIAALIQFENSDNLSMSADQIEYCLNEDWYFVILDDMSASKIDWDNHDKILKQVQEALTEKKFRKVKLPCFEESRAGDIVVFQCKLEEDYADMTLRFSTANTSIRVVLDGEIIYQYKFVEEALEEHVNYVNIPSVFENGNLLIELVSPYPNAASFLEKIEVKSHNTVLIGIVGNGIFDIGCCLFIIIMAIILFLLALIRRITSRPNRGEFYLGMAGLIAGLYCFIETDTLSIFYDMNQAYEMQEYLVLMIPLFLTLYIERNLSWIYPRRFLLLMGGMIIHAAAQIFLQAAAIRSMPEMINISAVSVSIVCVTAILSLIQFYYENRNYRILLGAFSVFILLAGGIANIILNRYYYLANSNMAGQYSMVIFNIMMAAIHTLQLSKEYRAAAEESALLLAEKVKMVEQQNTQLLLAKKDAEAARQEAMAANDAKGKFLARMSHEIRTPINAVLGMDEMILRESNEQNIKDYAMDIHLAGQTLLSLINDILDFSKIDSGKMEIVPVEYDISSMIHDLANMTSQRAKDKNIKLELSIDSGIPSRLYGDDVRIRQILTNILTNAVKYTNEGTIWLRVSCRKTDKTAILKFEVEDTGIGIKEEDLPKLSAEFERIEEERNRNIEGTGLGMSITIQLLALLNSKLLVESTYGKGSKFYFELEQKIISHTPIGDFESRVQKLSESYDYNTKFCAPDAKILVVDDNAVNRKVLRNLLKETQVQITDAPGGAECLALVQKNHYDLIFLDHMMPEMDGVETLHHMKELSDYPCRDTPVIVLTANAVSGAKENYLAEGFDDFLSKPIVPEKLETMMKKMLPKGLLKEPSERGQTSAQKPQNQETAADGLDELPQVDGLDWQYAWMHLPDMELLSYTVKEFYAQIDSAADRLESAYRRIGESGQLEDYRIQVHAMKSLAATVGIMPLFGVAKILEYAARDEKTDVIMSVTDAFLDEWRSYRQKLSGVFGIEDTAGSKIEDYSVISALVEMIRISMQDFDIDRADQLMDQLRSYEYPKEMEQTVRDLSEAVTNLDADEADRLADILIGQTEGKTGH